MSRSTVVIVAAVLGAALVAGLAAPAFAYEWTSFDGLRNELMRKWDELGGDFMPPGKARKDLKKLLFRKILVGVKADARLAKKAGKVIDKHFADDASLRLAMLDVLDNIRSRIDDALTVIERDAPGLAPDPNARKALDLARLARQPWKLAGDPTMPFGDRAKLYRKAEKKLRKAETKLRKAEPPPGTTIASGIVKERFVPGAFYRITWWMHGDVEIPPQEIPGTITAYEVNVFVAELEKQFAPISSSFQHAGCRVQQGWHSGDASSFSYFVLINCRDEDGNGPLSELVFDIERI